MLRDTTRSARFGQALASLLRSRRSSLSLSQNDLAAELGIDQASVSRVESNERMLTVEETLRWMEALGFSAIESSDALLHLWVDYGSRSASIWESGVE